MQASDIERILTEHVSMMIGNGDIYGCRRAYVIDEAALPQLATNLAEAITGRDAALRAGEALYRRACDDIKARLAGEPAEPDALKNALQCLETWGPEALPANEQGQVPFARALLELATDALRAALAAAPQL